MKIGIIGAGNIGEVIVLSIPFAKYPDLATHFDVPNDVAVIDTSNSYPFRDGAISEIVSGKPESVWVSEQIGRRSTKPGTPYWRRHSERANLRPVARKFSYSVVAKTTISILQC